MKQKSIILSVFTLLFCGIINAQNITWGNEIKQEKGKSQAGIIAEDSEAFYVSGFKSKKVLFGYKRTFTIEKYNNKDMTLVYSKLVPNPQINGEETDIESIIYVDGQFVIFSTLDKKETKTQAAYAHKMSTDCVLELDYVELGEVGIKSKIKKGFFEYKISENNKYFLVVEVPPFDKYASEKFNYRVFDKDFKIIWKSEIELPYKDKNFLISDFFLDNNANVFMLAKVFPELEKGEKRDKSQPNSNKVILSYDHKSSTLKEYVLKVGDSKFPTDMSYFIEGGKLKVCGFYSENVRTYSAAGVFYLAIDLDSKQVQESTFQPFTKEFIAKYVGDRKANKIDGLSNFDIKTIIKDGSGGFSFIAEYYQFIQRCSTHNGVTTCTYHYYYNDLIVVKVDNKGLIEWTEKISKAQHSVNDGGYYSSYIAGLNNGKLYIIFNDNPKNFKPLAEDPYSRKIMSPKPKKSVCALVTMDLKTGSFTRELLFTNKDSKTILRPKIYRQLSDNEIYVYAIRSSLYKFGKITF